MNYIIDGHAMLQALMCLPKSFADLAEKVLINYQK